MGGGVLRAQLTCFALAGLAVPLTVLLSWIGYLLTGGHDLAAIGFAVLYVAVPVATRSPCCATTSSTSTGALTTAILYGTLTAGLLAVFTAVSFAGGLLLGSDSVAAAAGVTAASALALGPLRARLQRALDRRFYPLRRQDDRLTGGRRECQPTASRHNAEHPPTEQYSAGSVDQLAFGGLGWLLVLVRRSGTPWPITPVAARCHQDDPTDLPGGVSCRLRREIKY